MTGKEGTLKHTDSETSRQPTPHFIFSEIRRRLQLVWNTQEVWDVLQIFSGAVLHPGEVPSSFLGNVARPPSHALSTCKNRRSNFEINRKRVKCCRMEVHFLSITCMGQDHFVQMYNRLSSRFFTGLCTVSLGPNRVTPLQSSLSARSAPRTCFDTSGRITPH